MQTYREILDFIDHIGKYSEHPGIENSARMLEVLGHPERGLFIIHVAGTNGKGSVCAFLADMLTAQGYRTGLFVSPHLVDIRERIQLDREMIGKEDFVSCFHMVQAAAKQLAQEGYTGITYFDYLFAVALCWYRQKAVDYVVLETGLGGRMDSTNAVEKPILTVITSISLDHTEILGDTIEKIAAEKAGIVKPGVPLIYCADEAGACAVIAKTAREKAAPCVGVGRRHCTLLSGQGTNPEDGSFPVTAPDISALDADASDMGAQDCPSSSSFPHCLRFFLRLPAEECGVFFPDGIRETLTVNSPALYQMENAAIAYMAALWVYLLDKPSGSIPESLRATLREALFLSAWEGRFEEILPNVYLDGAHNADGIRMLLASLRPVVANRKATLLFTAVKEKDTAEMIREVCESGLFGRYLVTTVGGARAIAPEELKALFLTHTDAPVATFASPQEAFAAGLEEMGGMKEFGGSSMGCGQGKGILLCAGSLYLVGIIKELLMSGG